MSTRNELIEAQVMALVLRAGSIDAAVKRAPLTKNQTTRVERSISRVAEALHVGAGTASCGIGVSRMANRVVGDIVADTEAKAGDGVDTQAEIDANARAIDLLGLLDTHVRQDLAQKEIPS